MTKKHLHTESKSKKYNLIQFRLLFLALWFPVEGAGPGGTSIEGEMLLPLLDHAQWEV